MIWKHGLVGWCLKGLLWCLKGLLWCLKGLLWCLKGLLWWVKWPWTADAESAALGSMVVVTIAFLVMLEICVFMFATTTNIPAAIARDAAFWIPCVCVLCAPILSLFARGLWFLFTPPPGLFSFLRRLKW